MRNADVRTNGKTQKILSYLFVICLLFFNGIKADAARIEEIQCEEFHEGIGGLEEIQEPEEKSLYPRETLLNGSSFAGAYREQLDDLSKQVYDSLYQSYLEGPHSDKVDLGLPELVFKDQQITVDATNSFSISSDLRDQISTQIDNSVKPAFYALLYDHPELNWLINVRYSTSWSMSISDYRITSIKRPLTVSGVTVTISQVVFKLAVIYTDTGDKESMDQALDTAIAAMKGYPYYIDKVSTDEKRIRIIHDYVCNTVAYTSGSTSDRAYQTPYSALIGRETVCAGYAKAFKLLCARYDIPCVLISGWGKTSSNGSGESHMWNYVQLDDSWYGVDCTWDDQTDSTTGKIYYDFYLTGSETKDTYFGRQTFADSHVESAFWSGADTEFQYPELAFDKYEAHEHNYVNGSCTICGKSVQIRINAQPIQPSEVTFGYTMADRLSVTAENDASAEMAYQWYCAPIEERDGQEIPGNYEAVEGAVADSFQIPAGYNAGKWSFYCRVSCCDFGKDSDPVTFVVNKAVPGVRTGQKEYEVCFGAKDFDLGCAAVDTQGETVGLTYEVEESENALGAPVENDRVVTVDTDGKVTITGAGNAVILVWCQETANTAQTKAEKILVSVSQAEVEELGEYGYPLKTEEGKTLADGQPLKKLQFDTQDAMFWFYNGSDWLYGFYDDGALHFGLMENDKMQIVAVVKGEFRWKDPEAVLPVGENEAEWVFAENGSTNLKTLSGKLKVTVTEKSSDEPSDPEGGMDTQSDPGDGTDKNTEQGESGGNMMPSVQDQTTGEETPVQKEMQTQEEEKQLPIGYVYTDPAKKALYRITDEGEVSYACTDKNSKTVSIPSVITINGEEYEVTSVAANAFKNCKKLKKVTLGKNIAQIGSNAFLKCTALKKLTIGDGVEKIGKNAFSGCKSLKTINIRTEELTAKNVGSKAFKGIAADAVIKVPRSVKEDYIKIFKKKGAPKTVKIK
jgi:hypothetical protein